MRKSRKNPVRKVQDKACVLIATDLAPRSASVIPMGAALARSQGLPLVALHVVGLSRELERAGTSDLRILKKLLARTTSAALKRLTAQVRAHGRGLASVRCLVRVGTPGTVICQLAEERRAAWVVVGRGAEGTLGSTAERVVRQPGLTVVVVPVGRPRPDFNLVAPQPRDRKERRPLPPLPRRARKGRVAARLAR